MHIAEAYRTFIDDRRINGLADSTLAFYEDTVGKFAHFCHDSQLEEASREINPYLLSLKNRGLAQNSLHAHWRGIRAFWIFAFEEGFIDHKARLPKIKEEKKHVKPLSLSQIRQVLRSFDMSNFSTLRNQTIIHLMFDTGIRLSEVAKILIPDLDLMQQWILIKGKGEKDRWVPFSDSAKRQLWIYLKQRSKYATDGEDTLFIQQNGTQFKSRGIQIMFRRLAEKMSFGGIRLSPHTIRHSFALNWIEGGGDPFSLQKILGHSSQTKTSRYVAMAKSTIKAQHNRYSPAERI